MKKVNFKSVFMTAVAILAFFFVGMGTTTAQSADLVSANSYQQLFSPPTGNFVSKGEAEILLNDKILDLKQLAVNASQQLMQSIEIQAAFYQTILDEVEASVSIPQSIATGVSFVAPEDTYGLSQGEITTLRDEAVDLLTN